MAIASSRVSGAARSSPSATERSPRRASLQQIYETAQLRGTAHPGFTGQPQHMAVLTPLHCPASGGLGLQASEFIKKLLDALRGESSRFQRGMETPARGPCLRLRCTCVLRRLPARFQNPRAFLRGLRPRPRDLTAPIIEGKELAFDRAGGVFSELGLSRSRRFVLPQALVPPGLV